MVVVCLWGSCSPQLLLFFVIPLPAAVAGLLFVVSAGTGPVHCPAMVVLCLPVFPMLLSLLVCILLLLSVSWQCSVSGATCCVSFVCMSRGWTCTARTLVVGTWQTLDIWGAQPWDC